MFAVNAIVTEVELVAALASGPPVMVATGALLITASMVVLGSATVGDSMVAPTIVSDPPAACEL